LRDTDANADRFRRLHNPGTAYEEPPYRLFLAPGYGRAPKALARHPSPRQARFDALDNHGPLELGKHAHHLKHSFASWCRRVDPLLVQVQIDALAVEFTEEPDEILQRSAKAIDRPGRDEVKLAASNALAQAIKGGSLVATLAATDPFVCKRNDDLPPVPFGGHLEFTLLVLDCLFGRGDPQVYGDALHAPFPT